MQQNEEVKDQIESDDLFDAMTNVFNKPKDKIKKYFLIGGICIAVLVIMAAIFGVTVAQYKTGTYCMEYIKNSCTCDSSVKFLP